MLAFFGMLLYSFGQNPIADFSGSPTTICPGGSVTWANLSKATGNNITYEWSFPGATNTSSNAKEPSTRTYNNPGIYSVKLHVMDINGGDTITKVNYITVIPNPTITVTPPVGYICYPGSVTLNASGTSTYTWSPSSGLNTTTGSVVIANRSSDITYTVKGIDSHGCKAEQNVDVVVNSNTPSSPNSISGPPSVCNGQSEVVFTVPSTSNQTEKIWTVPSGATITSGQGTRSITVTFGNTSGSVCCSAKNGCGTSTPTCLTVSVNPTPSIGTIVSISGPTNFCINKTGVTYSVSPVANSSNYNWTVNGGASIASGQGTNKITVNFGTSNSEICVTASNSCNSTPKVCMTTTLVSSPPSTPGNIAGSTKICSGQGSVTYYVASVWNAFSYTWSVPPGAMIKSGQGTSSITVTFGSSSGSVCVTADNACGTSSQGCTAVTVDPNPAIGAIGAISGSHDVCANQSLITYSIPAVAGATNYAWTVPAGATITSGQGTNTIVITYATSGGDVCVTASNTCSSSKQVCIKINVSPSAPSIPGVISGPTTVCSGQSHTNYSVASVANATNYTWTVPSGAVINSGQGTNSVTITFQGTGGSICVSAGNACGTSLGTCLGITVDPNPTVDTLKVINGPQSVCENQTNIIFSVGAVNGATTYSWTVPASASITAGQGTRTIEVTFASTNGNVCVTASNSCSSSEQECIPVSISSIAPGIPGTITGPTTICKGAEDIKYSVAAVANATNYNWTVPSGATITAGQSTTTVTVTFGTISGNVCVSAGNACGTSLGSCRAITLDTHGAVGKIDPISGPSEVCANQSGIKFYVNAVSNATNYTWVVPTGATVTAGQGTNSVTVTLGSTAGNICVTANNSCSSTKSECESVNLSPGIPNIPGAVKGVAAVCNSQKGIVYSVDSIANATVYTWAIPAGAVITSGQGTRSVTIDYGSSSGSVCVTAGNACGTSMGSCVNVTVNQSSAIGSIGTITGSKSVCTNLSGVVYSIPAVANASTYSWTIPANATITAGQGTNSITITFGSSSGTVCVTASNSCNATPQVCFPVDVSPSSPSIPSGLTGSSTVCNGQYGVAYNVTAVANALAYNWTIPAGANITNGQGTTAIRVSYGNSSGTVCVTASNGCGISLPACKVVTVNSSTFNSSLTSNNASCWSCCDGKATVTPIGGTGPYTYKWSSLPGQTTSAATGLCAKAYTVCVTNEIGCESCSEFVISSPVDVQDVVDSKPLVKVFPNPAYNEITVEIEGSRLSTNATIVEYAILLFNHYGQQVSTKTFRTGGKLSENINIELLPAGLYFIKIRAGESYSEAKFIKAK